MKTYQFNNDVCINLEQIESVGRPIIRDPYNKTYGAEYDIVMTSGTIHTCYEFIKDGAPTFGRIVMNRDCLLSMMNTEYYKGKLTC